MLHKALPNLSFGLRASHKPEVLGKEPEVLGMCFFCRHPFPLALHSSDYKSLSQEAATEGTSEVDSGGNVSQGTSEACSDDSNVSVGSDSQARRVACVGTRRSYKTRSGSKVPTVKLDKILPCAGLAVCLKAAHFFLGVTWHKSLMH